MEIDITEFYKNCAPMDYSASVAEIGRDAGTATWDAAMEDSSDYPMIVTEEQEDAWKEQLRGYGAWEPSQIDDWTNQELNALFMQEVASGIRGMGTDAGSRLFCGIDGKNYYYVGE